MHDILRLCNCLANVIGFGSQDITQLDVYMNPNERRVNQQRMSDVCANRIYQYVEELKDQVSEYLNKQFGRWC